MNAKLVKKKKKSKNYVPFSPYITLPDGRVIYAKDYGLKAFPLRG